METLGLLVRVGLSLAAVLGLVWLIGRGMLRRPGARGAAGASLQVLARSQLSRTASVSVVGVGERALVLGVTEQRVTVLSRMTLAELGIGAEPEPEPEAQRTVLDLQELDVAKLDLRRSDVVGRRSALTGSALSPGTWAQAVRAVRERTTRR